MNAVFGVRSATVALVLLALCAAVVLAVLVAGADDPGQGPSLAGNGVIHTTE